MTLSIDCKGAGDAKCEYTVTGETVQELMENGKKHAKGSSRDVRRGS